MAQGQALSAFTIGYLLTNKEEYIELVRKVLFSFTRLYNRDDPWFVYVDQNNYLWIEEYPDSPPSHVLNGFIYAIFGLYDVLMFLPIEEKYKNIAKELLSAE